MAKVELTETEKREILQCLEEGKPLDDKFRFLLFGDKREVELVWNGKTSEVCNVVLPFQVIEQVDEPRGEKKKAREQVHSRASYFRIRWDQNVSGSLSESTSSSSQCPGPIRPLLY